MTPTSTPRGRLALSVEEAAAAVGVSRSLLYREISARRLPSFKLGGRRLVPVDALGAWLKAEMQRQQAETDGEGRG